VGLVLKADSVASMVLFSDAPNQFSTHDKLSYAILRVYMSNGYRIFATT